LTRKGRNRGFWAENEFLDTVTRARARAREGSEVKRIGPAEKKVKLSEKNHLHFGVENRFVL
jgi:hypothetical protein